MQPRLFSIANGMTSNLRSRGANDTFSRLPQLGVVPSSLPWLRFSSQLQLSSIPLDFERSSLYSPFPLVLPARFPGEKCLKVLHDCLTCGRLFAAPFEKTMLNRACGEVLSSPLHLRRRRDGNEPFISAGWDWRLPNIAAVQPLTTTIMPLTLFVAPSPSFEIG